MGQRWHYTSLLGRMDGTRFWTLGSTMGQREHYTIRFGLWGPLWGNESITLAFCGDGMGYGVGLGDHYEATRA